MTYHIPSHFTTPLDIPYASCSPENAVGNSSPDSYSSASVSGSWPSPSPSNFERPFNPGSLLAPYTPFIPSPSPVQDLQWQTYPCSLDSSLDFTTFNPYPIRSLPQCFAEPKPVSFDAVGQHASRVYPLQGLAESASPTCDPSVQGATHILLPARRPTRQRKVLPQKGKQVFRCTYRRCTMVFYKRNAYQDHVRVHTRERPFSCHYCKRCFSVKANCKRHGGTCKIKKAADDGEASAWGPSSETQFIHYDETLTFGSSGASTTSSPLH